MKLALLAPSPQPYLPGGAENLLAGLYAALREQGQHQVELIKHPAPESNFTELLASYRHFSRLNLDHFDAIISCKYPAWMVSHPQHSCWMLHKLRGLYDTYPPGWPQQLNPQSQPAQLQPLLQLLAAPPSIQRLEESFSLAEEASRQHPEAFCLPGPLVRQLVHYWDAVAQRPGALQHNFAISAQVKNRPGYFPKPEQVQVLHPPVSLNLQTPAAANPSKQRVIFTASRLDTPKRVDLIIRAFLRLNTTAALHIAGEGPQKTALQHLANHHPCIHFLGHLSEAQLATAYQQADFIVFTPQDEDYGLIAPEALTAGRPVITTQDAGGVTELVRHHHNGLIVQPSAQALAMAMQRLLDHPEEQHRLAQNAQASVSHLTWPATLKQLLAPLKEPVRPQAPSSPLVQNSKALKLVVAATFPAWPIHGGGQQRLFQLYRQLARHHQVHLVCLGPTTLTQQLAPGLIHHQCAYTAEQHRISGGVDARTGKDLTDVVAAQSTFFNPRFMHTLQQQLHQADYAIACHPFLYPALRACWQGPLIYEAQDVEPDVKASLLKASPHAPELLKRIHALEAACLNASQLVITCSQEDALRLQHLYSHRVPPSLVVPNGVDTQQTPFTSWQERQQRRQRLQLSNKHSLLFMGSLHPPNVEAAHHLIHLAHQLPQYDFWLVGSVCNAPSLPPAPSNLRKLGLVTEAQRQGLQASATLALNPMTSGSGTNLKMLEYTAAGLPVITTPFGLRGLNFKAEEELLVASVNNFAASIHTFLNWPFSQQQKLVTKARKKTEKYYDWHACAQPFLAAI